MESHEPGAIPYTYWLVENGRAKPSSGGVIAETLLAIYVNVEELATLMCSPMDQEALALGFLYNEEIIESLDDVKLAALNIAQTGIDIFLRRTDFDPPRRMTLTSGCGGGVTFQHLADSHPPLSTPFTTTPGVVLARMRDLQGASLLYRQVRGIHTATLGDETCTLLSAEDVGRHNTIDKIAGKALGAGIDTRDKILLTSGRVSSEMLMKARRMGVPLVASRTSPTSIALSLAQEWHICVAGYVRQGGMRVYTHPGRLGLPDSAGRPVDAVGDPDPIERR